MLGFKNERFLKAASSIMNIFRKDTDYLLGSKPNMGKETSFDENDLTTDPKRYMRIIKLVRKHPDIRLWGVTNAFAKAVNKRLNMIRKKNWAEEINLSILIINNKMDKVVDAKKINVLNKRLKNSQIIEFQNTQHEIFMEKDSNRKVLWDNFNKNKT